MDLLSQRLLQQAQARRLDSTERQSNQSVQYITIHGVFSVKTPGDTGEANTRLVFPVLYIEMPNPRFSMVLPEGENPTTGHYPRLDAHVTSWGYKQIEGKKYYTGALVGVRLEAVGIHNMNVHWEFVGKAIRSPGSSIESLDDVL